MAETQHLLNLSAPAPADLAHDGAVELAKFLLRSPDGPGKSGGWSAAHLCRAFGLPPTDSNKRKIRAFAEAAGPVIVSGPGTPYRHRAHCTAADIRDAAEPLISQGRKMIERGTALLASAHRDLAAGAPRP